MSENQLTDEQVNAKQNSTLAGGVALPANQGEEAYDWDLTFLLALYCLHRMSAASNAGRVYHDSTDGDLECSVYACQYFNGDTAVDYSGATNQTLTNSATNYLYLTAAGVLTINTTGFPAPSVTPHIPLATIVCADGEWDPDADITDYRGRGIFTVAGAAAAESFSVYNDSGSEIAAGSPLSICGYDSANDMFEVELADADGTDKPAQAFAKTAIANATVGVATNQHDLTGLDTSAASAVGASVYLSDTAGGWTLTAPTGANQMKQEIGVVTVKDAATGAIRFKVGLGGSREKVGTDGLEALAITAAKLAADAVETAKIKDLNVTEGKLAALCVTAAKLAADAVETAKIKDLNITAAKLAADAVETAKIKDLNVTEGKLAALAVTAAKLAADAVETAKIKDLNVTEGKLAANAVSVAKLAAAVQDLLPNILLTGTDDGDGTGTCAIQVRDAANNNLAQRFLIRVWIADAEFSEPDPQTDFDVLSGEMMRQIEADADYEVISDTNGAGNMNIDAGGAKTVYVMAELDGRIYSSGAIAITVP